MNERNTKVKSLVMTAILTALVVLLQFMGSFVRFGPFSVSLVLIPIVIGAAKCGMGAGAWLGFVFGATVLASGDAAPFVAASVLGTIITVLAKGIAAGFAAGAVFSLVSKLTKSTLAATICSAVICPVVNTGVFLIGCLLFFMDTIAGWTSAAGLGSDVGHYMIFVLVGANFIFELIINAIFAPTIVHILKSIEK